MNLKKVVFLLVFLVLFIFIFSAVHASGNDLNRAVRALAINDFSTAERVFTRLAKQGQPDSQRYLGDMYDKGLGVTKDYGRAVVWYRKAAEQKDAASQYKLAIKYANGHGLPLDKKLAYAWFAVAYDNGHAEAADPLLVLNKTMTTDERQDALTLAIQFKKQYH